MKNARIIAVAIILGMPFGGLLLIKSFNSVAPKTIAQVPAQINLRSARAGELKPIWIRPVEPASWFKMLSDLQADTNEFFGAAAEDRMTELQNFAESIVPADLPQALQELQALQTQNPTIAGHDLEMRLLRQWAGSDPSLAAKWAGGTPDSIRQEALAAVAEIWAKQDFSKVAAWAGQLPDDSDREAALKSAVNEAVYSEPMEALKILSQLPADSTRDQLVAQAIGTWTAAAPKDAVAWAQQVPDETLRQQIISQIAMIWGNTDPASAANLAANSLAEGKLQDDTVIAIVQRWGIKDAKAAEEWVEQFPAGDLRQAALATLADAAARTSEKTGVSF